MKRELKLCYVKGAKAYFTTQEIDRQWGDDWNDAPYEHNAGTPYKEEGHNIKSIYFEADLYTPEEFAGSNSRYSVEMINNLATPWLSFESWSSHKTVIFAGESLEGFIEKVQSIGGKVYVEYE